MELPFGTIFILVLLKSDFLELVKLILNVKKESKIVSWVEWSVLTIIKNNPFKL
jgi:hypothetical protein